MVHGSRMSCSGGCLACLLLVAWLVVCLPPAKNATLFLSFTYVCPEPVLVRISFLKYKWRKKWRFSHLDDESGCIHPDERTGERQVWVLTAAGIAVVRGRVAAVRRDDRPLGNIEVGRRCSHRVCMETDGHILSTN